MFYFFSLRHAMPGRTFPSKSSKLAPPPEETDKIPADKMGMDIGEKTRKLYAEKIASAKAVI